MSRSFSFQSNSNSFSIESSNFHPIDTQDLEKLRKQVQDYEDLVNVLEMQIQERRVRYSESLDQLRQSKVRDQEKFENDLEQQEIEQNMEFAQQQKKLDKQFEMLQQTAIDAQNDLKLWKHTHDTIKDVKAGIESTQIQKQILENENTLICAAIQDAAETRTLQKTKKEKSKSIKNMVDELQNTVNNYKQNLSFQNERYRSILNEISSTLQLQQTCFDMTKQKIIREMQKRDKFFNKHISIVEQTIQQEVRQTEFDIQSLDSQVKTMHTIKKETVKRCNTLMSRFTKDIQKMKRALEDSNTSFILDENSSLSLSKNDSMMRQRDDLKQKETRLYMELSKVTDDIGRCADVLQDLVNSERSNSMFD